MPVVYGLNAPCLALLYAKSTGTMVFDKFGEISNYLKFESLAARNGRYYKYSENIAIL